jgi:hypothetical protein
VPVTSDTSIEAALEPVKLIESICKGGCDIGSRFSVQTLCLDCRAPAAAFRRERLRFRALWAWLGGLARPAASLPATASFRSRMSFMITFGFAEDQIGAIACMIVGIGARHVKRSGTARCGPTVRGSSSSIEFSPGRDSAEMISDGCPDTNGKVLI